MSNGMNGLIPCKKQKYWSLGVLGLIILLITISFFQKSKDMVNYEDEINYEYKGFVVNKYIDSSDHSICKLKLKSGEIVNVWDNCYKKVDMGDSIVKKKGDFNFLVYKSSGLIIVNIEDNLIVPKK